MSAPDLAVNLHGRGPQSHRLLQLLRPRRLFAYACPAAGHTDGPSWREEEHEVARWCRLTEYYGIPADPADRALTAPPVPTSRSRLTIVHPGAKHADRRWPPARFAALARELRAAGHRVVITGSLAERRLARRVATAAGIGPEGNLAGLFDVAGLAGTVAAARLLISGDTGIAHLASAYGTPSVVIFAAMDPARWGPPPDPRHQVLWHPRRAAISGPAALAETTVDDVLAAAQAAQAASMSGSV